MIETSEMTGEVSPETDIPPENVDEILSAQDTYEGRVNTLFGIANPQNESVSNLLIASALQSRLDLINAVGRGLRAMGRHAETVDLRFVQETTKHERAIQVLVSGRSDKGALADVMDDLYKEAYGVQESERERIRSQRPGIIKAIFLGRQRELRRIYARQAETKFDRIEKELKK